MLPYPGMPYGVAPAWCFPACEASMCLLLVLCLVHALRRGPRAVAYLLGGLLFGLTLEYIEVATGSYTYGRFALMLGRPPFLIPLCIGAGWAIIMYTARLFSDALRLPLLAAAALDTLLALNIDLGMDVVAYRLHMWHWSWVGTGLNPLRAQWFGVPWGNFVGWATVVFCYSAFSRLFERSKQEPMAIWRAALGMLLAFVCSQAVLFGTETFVFPFMRDHLRVTSFDRLIAIALALLLLTAWGWTKRRTPQQTIPAVALWVPLWFHLFFLGCFFALGFYRENAAMTVAACVNFTIGVVVHATPWWLRGRVTQKDDLAEDSLAAA